MRDDFAVFICTHGRAKEQVTYKTLRNSGYTGKVYFVIDDLDEQGDEYKRLYGENVLVFGKEEQYAVTDTFTNQKILQAVVYARNACFDFAKRLGVNWFVNCDDDIECLSYKMPINGKLVTKPVKDADRMFESVITFMETGSIECFSIAEEGVYVGGINSRVEAGCHWSFTHLFVFDACSELRYRSVWVEDNVFSLENLKLGRRMIASMYIAQRLPSHNAAQKQEGGMRDAYRQSNNYVKSFTPVITAPDCVCVCDKKGDIKTRKKLDSIMVKILPPWCRKVAVENA